MPRKFLTVILAIACLAVSLPALAVVVTLRLFRLCIGGVSRLLEPKFVEWQELMQFDALLGWKPRANLDAHYLAERDDVFKIVTGDDGWPGHRTVEESDILLIGDSFAFGYGIDTNKSFTARIPKLRIKPFGAPGYSMVQGFLILDELRGQLRDKVVVWCIYLENDLADNLMPNVRSYRAPFLHWDRKAGQWEIFTRHLSPQPWECSYFRDRYSLFCALHIKSNLSDRVFGACEELLKRAHALCSSEGATLAVMTIPHPSQLSASFDPFARLGLRSEQAEVESPDDRIEAVCNRMGIAFEAGRGFLRPTDYKTHEGYHWNESGHRQAAATLKRLYRSILTTKNPEIRPPDRLCEAAVPAGHSPSQ